MAWFTAQDWLRRGIRTFLQASVGVFLSLMVTPHLPGALGGDAVPERGVFTSALIAAGWSGVIAVLTALHNALEDNTAFPAILKAPASSGQNPEPDPDPDPFPIGAPDLARLRREYEALGRDLERSGG